MDVPHTVLFEYSKPSDWYFSKKAIPKRKPKIKTTIDRIKSLFITDIGKSRICSYFIYRDKKKIRIELFDKNQTSKPKLTSFLFGK